jgi:catechol 2,3-dioxygenase-like lactoylglutathione lyase family enzyme
MKHWIYAAIAALGVAQAQAQLVEPNQVGLTMGHVHVAVKDVNAQKEFLVSVLGGRALTNGSMDLVEFPGTYIALMQADAPPPSAESIVDHFGFIVKDMPAQLARWKAMGVAIRPTDNPNEVFLTGPEGIRVEVYGEPALPTAISMNHIHYMLVESEIPAVKTWYVKAFGANPGRRACVACVAKPRMYEAGDLPGVNLTFSPGRKPPVATVGRAIDHIGFEVQHLDAFVRSLRAKGIRMDGPVRKVAGTNFKAAFLTDPWGTRIELTEGLAPE